MTLHKPQRLSQPAAPGALLKRAVNLHNIMRMRLIEPERDEAYLDLIRALPCLHCGMEPSEAAHVRMASAAHGKASGLGKTPADRWALPLCSEHHRNARDAQHKRGERLWWEALGVSPLQVAEQLYEHRGDLPAMRAIVLLAIAGRRS